MQSSVKVGTVLMKRWPGMPRLIAFEPDNGFGAWSVVEGLDGIPLESKIKEAGWNFFYMAGEVRATSVGSLGTAKLRSAVQRILRMVKTENFNSLEVTAIVRRHFLGVPYVTVFAHSRHMQESGYLDSSSTRQAFQRDAEWAKG